MRHTPKSSRWTEGLTSNSPYHVVSGRGKADSRPPKSDASAAEQASHDGYVDKLYSHLNERRKLVLPPVTVGNIIDHFAHWDIATEWVDGHPLESLTRSQTSVTDSMHILEQASPRRELLNDGTSITIRVREVTGDDICCLIEIEQQLRQASSEDAIE